MYHQQCLTESSATLPQYIISTERNDVAQRENEWVYVFHIEVVGCNSIGDRIFSQDVRFFLCIAVKRGSAISMKR